jgi:peptidoglycan hydrolase CwlO-like protein
MNKKIALFAMTAVLALPIAPAFAADSTTGNTTTPATTDWKAQRDANQQLMQQNKTERQQIQTERTTLNQQAKDQQQKNMQDRCTNIETKIGERVTKIEDNKAKFATAFGNMQARLQQLSDRLASKNIDVTKLNADIKTLADKIAKLQADHDAFIAGIKDVQASAPSACGASKGEFMGKLFGSRTASLGVEKDRLDIRNFFQTTIRPDIMAIRATIASQKPAVPTTTSATPAPTTDNKL